MNYPARSFDEVMAAVLAAPKPRPEFVAGLLASLAASAPRGVVLLPNAADPAGRRWLVLGTVAGATAAGVALFGWRIARRNVA